MSGGRAAPGRGRPGGLGRGEAVLALLSATLGGIRDRLHHDGYDAEADLVADLVDIIDDYLARVAAPNAGKCHPSSLQ